MSTRSPGRPTTWARYHRIEIIGTVLLSDNLSTHSMDRIESETVPFGVSSVVIQIGGLAAYPAMIPDDEPLEDTLITICHEWAFHYLALHRLGESYFSSYDMATINESLVDIVGHPSRRCRADSGPTPI